ncbi:kinase-like protein [Polyplosphaeria fusca]|uniref:Kinase-like protein n=1 Tax=Polyplosphaeria fusca TaxID=682080 RepID=A0A9P4R0X0_9PLEO|nr:kinase-like protein [Polyplosphaeria fusca]
MSSSNNARSYNRPPRSPFDGESRDRRRPNPGMRRNYRDESPQPYRHPRDRDRDRVRERSRSRSPYRHSRDRSPSPYRRGRDRSPSPYRNGRDRSPSPYRHSRGGRDRSSLYPGSRDSRNTRDGNRYDNGDAGSKRKSDFPQRKARPEKRYDGPLSSRQDRDAGSKSPMSLVNDKPIVVPKFDDTTLPKQGGQSKTNEGKHVQEDVRMTVDTQDNSTYSDIDDENNAPRRETREEKLAKWAAIRARHAALDKAEDEAKAKAEADKAPIAQSLLQQPLIGNASNMDTQDAGLAATSSENVLSPANESPNVASSAGSPDEMIIDKPQEDGKGWSPQKEERSAAGYNPDADLTDTRPQVLGLSSSKMSASSAHEEDLLLKKEPKRKSKWEERDDMFASDTEPPTPSSSPHSDQGGTAKAKLSFDDDQSTYVAAPEGVILPEKMLGNWTDVSGYYKIIQNELMGPKHRYHVQTKAGGGVYSTVARAMVVKEQGQPPAKEDGQLLGKDAVKELVAIKITRKNDAMAYSAKREARFLKKLNDEDKEDKKHIIRFVEQFRHKGHLCLVFENMERNLRTLLEKDSKNQGIPLRAVKEYARQMFMGLSHLENNDIIHFDLKPDNILVSADTRTIKLCDFGTAQEVDENYDHDETMVSRFYRAPDIILGMKYGPAIDMWSIGCTIYEVWTGKILFNGKTNNAMIESFLETLEWPSEKLVKKGVRSHWHFDFTMPPTFRRGEPSSTVPQKAVGKHQISKTTLAKRVAEGAQGLTADIPKREDLDSFTSLLFGCLHWNVEKRTKPQAALEHKFFGLGQTQLARKPLAFPQPPRAHRK